MAAESRATKCTNAIDTNVLIYSIDASEPVKRASALKLIDSLPETETVIPWQVACEVAAVLRKMGRAGKFRGDYAETLAALRSCFPDCYSQRACIGAGRVH